ncbi:hypoxanthine phosphoribosyltransferase [Marinigracilibium pacificum]|uniref:Hypoxanthine phosphoribosyltransferase n=1 Tax=Marinigracilibium pacificum TaxID=2729599 RepID=A0A848IZB7_9BACT|nr:hypoxanthine phosphoribosyltransferase [Marinigracilibium pacificum]NMM48711.1 hypoxanthine phosphoribosyltransferase [Marinigracilibium pacificum]
MEIQGKTARLYMKKDVLMSRVSEMSEMLKSEYKDKDPVFLIILNGAFMFASDLLKGLDFDCEISFTKVASYENTESTGEIKSLIGVNEQLAGRDVVIVEDIVDTGNTMKWLLDELNRINVKSIATCVLLMKPEVFNNQFEIDFLGFEIPNDFVVGYGMDFNGYGRNLQDIYQLD